MNTCAKLTQILNDRKITPKQDALCLYEFQQSALLALKECGTLTETQFRYIYEFNMESRELRSVPESREKVKEAER